MIGFESNQEDENVISDNSKVVPTFGVTTTSGPPIILERTSSPIILERNQLVKKRLDLIKTTTRTSTTTSTTTSKKLPCLSFLICYHLSIFEIKFIYSENTTKF